MLENKFSEVFPYNTSDKKKADREPVLADNKFKRFSELAIADNQRFVPRFQQCEYGPLFERALNDLFVNVEENVELNTILSTVNKKSQKSGHPKLQEKLELNIKNSLHKNLAQRSSIKKFMGLLFSDLIGMLGKKDVS